MREVRNDSVGRILGTLVESTMPQGLPVEPETTDWMTLTDPERLSRTFVFNSFGELSYFLTNLLSYQEETNHHANILISHRQIKIETYTHDINSVTESDLALARFCDEIYDDIFHIQRAAEVANERERYSIG